MKTFEEKEKKLKTAISKLDNLNLDFSNLVVLSFEVIFGDFMIKIDCLKSNLIISFKYKKCKSNLLGGFYKGQRKRYHDIQVDKNGNIYAADILDNSVQKFIAVKK